MNDIKLNPEAKAKWVAGLRSGKYEQGCGYLRTEDNKFCCLGVAEDIFVNKWKIPEVGNPFFGVCYLSKGYDSGKMVINSLSNEARHALCLEDCTTDLVVTIKGKTRTLWAHNDNREVTFLEIADAIEQQL